MKIGFVSNVKALSRAAGLLLALVLIVGMVAPAALAQSGMPPSLPHQFWGNVTVNGAPAPTGAAVSARIGGVEYGNGTVDAAGRYGDEPNFFVEAPAELAGQTISFYVAGVLAPETAVYQVGGNGGLDLSVTIVTPTPTPTPVVTPTPVPTQWGGGGGGGGGGGTPTPAVSPTRTATPTPTATISPTATPVPTVTVVPTLTPTSTATQTPTPLVTVAPTPTPTPKSTEGETNTWVIIGSVIAVIVIGLAILLFLGRRKPHTPMTGGTA